MKIVNEKIALEELKQMSEKMFGDLVKAVVDVEKEIIAVDMELHSDGEAELIENGSRQDNLWGINIHPEKVKKDFIEFDSVINIRPRQGNRSRGVDSLELQEKIKKIIDKLVTK